MKFKSAVKNEKTPQVYEAIIEELRDELRRVRKEYLDYICLSNQKLNDLECKYNKLIDEHTPSKIVLSEPRIVKSP